MGVLERVHGTHAGYWQHYKRGEPICEDCRRAHREHSRELRANNKDAVRERDRQRAAETRRVAARENSAWTAEEDAIVTADDGATQREKAIRLGRSQKSVKHRTAWLRKNRPAYLREKPTCSVEGCSADERIIKGMCPSHLRYWRLYGDTKPHGRLAFRDGCRCEVCVTAHDSHQRRQQRLRAARLERDRQRRRDPDYRSRERECRRDKYKNDEDYRTRLLDAQKKQRQQRPGVGTAYSQRWKSENPEKYRSLQQRMTQRNTERNLDSRSVAHNNGKEWTGPELELVATHPDMTAQQLAEVLGRTIASVTHARRKLRVEPREMNLAGT